MTSNISSQPDDIFCHSDEGFSLELADGRLRKVVAVLSDWLDVVCVDRDREIELLGRGPRQLQYLDDVHDNHPTTLRSAAEGARLSPKSARNLLDAAVRDNPFTRGSTLEGEDRPKGGQRNLARAEDERATDRGPAPSESHG